MQKLLLVEDDTSVRMTLVTFLELEGYVIDAVASTEEALARLAEWPAVSDRYFGYLYR